MDMERQCPLGEVYTCREHENISEEAAEREEKKKKNKVHLLGSDQVLLEVLCSLTAWTREGYG